MKQRITALLLALALTASLCATTAFAGETADKAQGAGDQREPQAESETGDEAESETGDEAETPASPAGPDEADVPEEAYTPDAVGTITFANLERRMRENNLNVLFLQESIDSIGTLDYDKMKEDLRTSLNGLAKMQWGLALAGQGDGYTYNQLDQAYSAMRDQFDAIRDGDLQEDNAGVIRQLESAQDQVFMAGESLFVALASLEIQEADLQRQLDALDRTVAEMELRYKLGQVSALQLEQTKAGRTALASGLETLRMNIETNKCQLEVLIGAEISGTIALGAVPEVTAAELEAMDLEKDLAAAKAASYTLYDAEETLKAAKEDYIDSLTGTYYLRDSAAHTWQGAQYTYSATVQNYELSFRTLYARVKDYKQILDASYVSLASQQASYAATELKYKQGTISQNTLLAAKDDLRAAEEAVRTASTNLFSAYNTYCWATRHGIIN